MDHIYVNLKRFDIPTQFGGINSISSPHEWAETILKAVQNEVKKYENNAEFTFFFPETHIIPAVQALDESSNIHIGSQSVFREDVSEGENFGAFTSNRTAKSMKAIGSDSVLIGHLEERNDYMDILRRAGSSDFTLVNEILNEEIKRAQEIDLSVLYCIGEREDEKDDWEEVLRNQLHMGLKDINKANITIAYEPVWSIGPGKTPPSKKYIQKIANLIKEEVGEQVPVVYGGGLQESNVEMISSIEELNGGLIALTRFSGEIGFYPEEFISIINLYFQNK